MEDSSVFATPQVRQGPTSRVLKRRSMALIAPTGIDSPRIHSPVKRHETTAAVSEAGGASKNTATNESTRQVFATTSTGMKSGGKSVAMSLLSAPNIGGDYSGSTYQYDGNETENTYGLFNLTKAAAGLNFSAIAASEIPATSIIDPDQTLLATDSAAPAIQATDNLYVDFLATVSEESSGLSTLDQVAELEELVSSHAASLKAHASHPNVTIGGTEDYRNAIGELKASLSNERNTWRLLGKLYHDRLTSDIDMEPEEKLLPSMARTSEKKLIENLFRQEKDLREGQIVVEWLEANARDDFDERARLDYFADGSVSWENTLAVLKGSDSHYRRPIISSMDPDAPRREGKPLHDLDAEDQNYLLRAMFTCIRAGLLETAQDLCIRVGQPWRAACLEGWKLFHDPNYGRCSAGGGGLEEKMPVEGNKNRDIWKRAVWKMIQDDKLSLYERAIFAPFCGHVVFLLNLCPSWEDWLWAYSRCMVDLRVESEIREKMPKSFVSLPQEYWDKNRRAFAEIFECISASDVRDVQKQSLDPYHTVQRYLINADLHGLLKIVDSWADPDNSNENERIKYPHLLRFLTHLVIIIRRICNHAKISNASSSISSDDRGSRVLRQYALFLMNKDRVQQIAWYVSQLFHVDEQIELYAMFLQTIYADADRRLTITLAQEAGLPIGCIKSRVVVNIFAMESMVNEDGEEDLDLLIRRKIDAISWLIYDKCQRDEAVNQANALMRHLVAMEKYDLARESCAKIPEDLVNVISTHCCVDGELSPRQSNSVAEYWCWQTYFRAKEAFSDWFEHYHRAKPIQPQLPENANFTEKVAYEQKLKQYNVEFERWQSSQELQSREACERLNATITFPGGWLVDQCEEQKQTIDENRSQEIDYLRKLCLPQLILLLHSVLHNTGQYDKAIQLADLVASEKHSLYEIYIKENMKELLEKLRESSLEAMATGSQDAWGHKINP